MTITYTRHVATCRHLGCFWILLFRWKGSIYKLLWVNMLIYIIAFISVKMIYIYGLNNKQKKIMMDISYYCQCYEQAIPLSFILGFYVAIVITRWWDQYLAIPWPDKLAVVLNVHLKGQDTRGRIMRRTIIRYANLSLAITLSMISPYIKRRFPSYQSYVDAGLLLASEHQRFKELEKKTAHPKHWVPLVWAIAIISRARKEGKIKDDYSKEILISEINSFRGQCGSLLNYDWICVPLVYPQVVSWAVYTFFAVSLISNQFPNSHVVIRPEAFILSIPIFPILQFFFYMGWLLVAETLANPFGEDDDDFDIGWLIDRHIQVSYIIVDEMHDFHPELLKDQYCDDNQPPDVPFYPHSDKDSPQEDSNVQMSEQDVDRDESKGPMKLRVNNAAENLERTVFVTRSLDFGSERVLRVHLPPSLSWITFGSRTTGSRSVMSKGSRPSGDQQDFSLQRRDMITDTIHDEVVGTRDVLLKTEDNYPGLSPFGHPSIIRNEYSTTQMNGNFIYKQQTNPNEFIDPSSSKNLIDLGDIRSETISNFSQYNSESSSNLQLYRSDLFEKFHDIHQSKGINMASNKTETKSKEDNVIEFGKKIKTKNDELKNMNEDKLEENSLVNIDDKIQTKINELSMKIDDNQIKINNENKYNELFPEEILSSFEKDEAEVIDPRVQYKQINQETNEDENLKSINLDKSIDKEIHPISDLLFDQMYENEIQMQEAKVKHTDIINSHQYDPINFKGKYEETPYFGNLNTLPSNIYKNEAAVFSIQPQHVDFYKDENQKYFIQERSKNINDLVKELIKNVEEESLINKEKIITGDHAKQVLWKDPVEVTPSSSMDNSNYYEETVNYNNLTSKYDQLKLEHSSKTHLETDEESKEFIERVEQSHALKPGTQASAILKLNLSKTSPALPTVIEIPEDDSENEINV